MLLEKTDKTDKYYQQKIFKNSIKVVIHSIMIIYIYMSKPNWASL